MYPASDDFGTEHELHILLAGGGPIRGDDLGKISSVGQEFTGRDGAATAYTCGHDGNLAGVAVREAGHNGIVAVLIGSLLPGRLAADTKEKGPDRNGPGLSYL